MGGGEAVVGVASGGSAGDNSAPVESLTYCEYPATEAVLRRGFRGLGLLCARRPWHTLALCAVLCMMCMLGMTRLHVVTDPERLWVGPGSQAAREKADYEAAFGPFYRVSQLILSTTPAAANSSHLTPSGLPAILIDANLRLLFDMQAAVDAVTADSAQNSTLNDLCFKPLGDACATQSVLQYWGGSREEYEGPGRLSPEFCIDHWSTACRAATGAPVDPKVVLGGFPTAAVDGEGAVKAPAYANDSTAFVITYLLSSAPEDRAEAEAWETAFLDLAATELHDLATSAGLQLSYSSERSVKDELARESGADAATVGASYLLMLLYVALALGSIPRRAASLSGILVHGRASLALGGVSIVGAAVAAALGICGWAGLGATLIIMEVIPFLALAVGVDNVFILTMAADRAPPGMAPEERAAAALAAAGPSILLAAAAETAGFSLGMLTSMPALQDFAACAAAAIAIDFLLQVTAFPAMLALDARRAAEGRYDCAPWLRAPAPWTEEEDEEDGPETSHAQQQEMPTETAEASGCDEDRLGVAPALRWYMRRVHAPALRPPAVKGAVVALFVGMFLCSCALLPRLEK